VHEIDAEVHLGDLNGTEVKGLMRFEPCGQGNQKPVLLARNVFLKESKTVGADNQHLKLTFKEGPIRWDAIAFRQGEAETAAKVDIVFSMQTGLNGHAELQVHDIAPSSTSRPLEGA
jgi:single-stranded-DNA-specific exonuclease